MNEQSLLDRCTVNTNFDNNTFVGIQCVEGNYKINFPLGFHMGENDKQLRKDVILLLNVLKKYTEKRDSQSYSNKKNNIKSFPIIEYLYVIKDFFERGYYKEIEKNLTISKRGKIDWNKTIKTRKPIIQNNEVYYLDYVIRKSCISENELITMIHKYCVYVSFLKLGWLFTSYVPPKPKLLINKKVALHIVCDKLQNTYNDRNKKLFSSLHAILKNDGTDVKNSFEFGTNNFEYVWERMIDTVFGINDKSLYFPKTYWNIINGDTYDNSSLLPDTIMICNNNIYIIDAKYYKYGNTGIYSHLPDSSSINKQITYGEYIVESEKFKDINGKNPIVYNAFIMPFDSQTNLFNTSKETFFVGIATSDWKTNINNYENIMGYLMDVKYLMNIDSNEHYNEIVKLSNIIETDYSIWFSKNNK